MSKARKQKSIGFNIRNIHVDEYENLIPENFDPPAGEKFQYSLEIRVGFSAEKSMVGIWVDYKFFDDKTTFIKLVVKNEFKISNISEVLRNDEIINETFVNHLALISVSHARGVQSSLMKEKSKRKFFIPAISPGSLRKYQADENEP